LRRFFVASACVASLFLVRASHAQTKEKPRRLHLGVGVDVLDPLGDECVQMAGGPDCHQGATFLEFAATASYRVLPWLALGGRFGAATRNTDPGGVHAPRHVAIWELAFEPRVYVLGEAKVSPFFGAALGFGSYRQTSAEVPERITRSTALVGGLVGGAFRLDDWLALEAEFRVLRMDFVPSPSAEPSDGHSTYYLRKAFLSFGLELVALLPV
jgi:hypothetical protein